MTAAAARTAVPEMIPIAHESTERFVRTIVFALPPAALGVGGGLAWGGALHWQDLLVLGITYTLTGLGITVGYHRLFTHRSFKTTRAVRALLRNTISPTVLHGAFDGARLLLRAETRPVAASPALPGRGKLQPSAAPRRLP